MSTVDTYSDDTLQEGFRPRISPALVILWSEEPEREGEVAHMDMPCVLGRGPGEGEPRALFVRQRPGGNQQRPLLKGARLSRRQLEIAPEGEELQVKNVGRSIMWVNGKRCKEARVRAGDIIMIRKSLVLRATVRQWDWPSIPSLKRRDWPSWGQPDRYGVVGESPAIWQLRERIAFIGPRSGHVLIFGDSGAGKELVARALHSTSDRSRKPLISRNAATIPEGLVDAELFGNIKDYPNPGMPARPGLVGEADGSTLFLDEIAEIPQAMHAHLLRVLDSPGEYHRLGEGKPRTADIRMVAATNRGPKSLKHDLLARFRLRVKVAGLNERMDDLPFLASHLLRMAVEEDPAIEERCFDEDGRPMLDAKLMAGLARRRFTHHVRELDTLLWKSISSMGDSGILSHEPVHEPEPKTRAYTDPSDLTPEEIQDAWVRSGEVLKKTWRALGLKNRFQLIRLMKKYKLGSYADDDGS